MVISEKKSLKTAIISQKLRERNEFPMKTTIKDVNSPEYFGILRWFSLKIVFCCENCLFDLCGYEICCSASQHEQSIN